MITLLLACSDYQVRKPDPPTPVEPPGVDPDADIGSPPDWTTCGEGWHGVYANLTAENPAVEPEEDVLASDPTTLDWWDDVSFRQFDGSLDIGQNWWPVDEGIAEDPLYFAVRWTAWIRGYSDTTVEAWLGSDDDAWVLVNGDVVASQPGLREFEPEVVTFTVQAGQFPIDIRYAQRAGDTSGFRFRVLSGDVGLCYPDFSEEG